MSNQTFEFQEAARKMAAQAVRDGVRTPAGLLAYFKTNGWEYDTYPTKPTMIELLKRNKVEYVDGYWTVVN